MRLSLKEGVVAQGLLGEFTRREAGHIDECAHTIASSSPGAALSSASSALGSASSAVGNWGAGRAAAT
jgi:hypothetical protein